MSNSIYSDIISNIRTKENMDSLLGLLTQLASGIYVSDAKRSERLLMQEVNIALGESIIKAIKNENILWSDFEKLSTFFAELKKEVQKLDVIELVISFIPSQKSIAVFNHWISDNLGKNIVIKTTYDPSVLGGAIIVYKGKYLDYTIKRYLDTNLKDNADLAAILH